MVPAASEGASATMSLCNQSDVTEAMSKPIWTPTTAAAERAALTDFMREASRISGTPISNYAMLHHWSTADMAGFWGLVWDRCGVVGDKGGRVLVEGDTMTGARFFPDARLNFAENLLQRRGTDDAIVFRNESQSSRRLSWDELRDLVSRLQQLFLSLGLRSGDRVAAMMPNMPETVACMLAATSLGAVWSSCSPDFGEQGVVDRFSQIEPVLFIAADGYWYNGKQNDVSAKVATIVARLTSVRKALVVDNLAGARQAAATIEGAISLADALAEFTAGVPIFERLPFDHPLYILFSSGTTGVPKCIVHSAGGTLIQHLKEHQLHSGIEEGDRFFYFTTCSWMMWNWLVSGLASGAALLLYDGSPFFPDGNTLFNLADAEKATFFGTSAKFIDVLRKSGLRPVETHDLSSLRSLASTGSPLSPEGFAFVYDGIKRDIHLASISGGTDIVSCFVLGVPTEPVRIGEIQGPGLGMAVDVWDDAGQPVRQRKGELVCTKPFPSMPIGFWNDPDGAKYRSTYFSRFEGVWCHGDWAEWTEHGGMIIHGRSDATLNPGGVRIGTAEIYGQVEQMPEILEALCIGQDFEGDVRVVLFVRLADGMILDQELIKRIKAKIRYGASPRHVPARIIAVPDIPRTMSGKIAELAVRNVVHGEAVNNRESLANPRSLEFFRNLEELNA